MRQSQRIRDWCTGQWHSHINVLVWFFATVALILGIIALNQWGALNSRRIPAAWGDVPGWIGALGTVAAFGALAIAISQWRAGLADQARLIVVQPARDNADQSTAFLADDEVVIHNHSDRPVFDLQIESLEPGVDDRAVWERLNAQNLRAVDLRPVFRPNETTGTLTVAGRVSGCHQASTPKLQYLAFAFTDANGRRWRRTGTRQPVRIHSD